MCVASVFRQTCLVSCEFWLDDSQAAWTEFFSWVWHMNLWQAWIFILFIMYFYSFATLVPFLLCEIKPWSTKSSNMSPNVGHIFVYRSDQATVCAWAKIIKNGAKNGRWQPSQWCLPFGYTGCSWNCRLTTWEIRKRSSNVQHNK